MDIFCVLVHILQVVSVFFTIYLIYLGTAYEKFNPIRFWPIIAIFSSLTANVMALTLDIFLSMLLFVIFFVISVCCAFNYFIEINKENEKNK